jgi:peptidoglycan hydrolase CwlO-like protein
MKKIKKIFTFLLILSCMFYFSYTGSLVEAKTFGELKAELKEEEEELRNNKNQQALTKEEMASVNSKITTIQNNIQATYRDIENLSAEIESLQNSIEQKQEQIKEIMNFIQKTDSENSYLEYIFNASDFTDFIYRSAIAEQLADYNDKLVDEYNLDIENNKKKQKEIEEKRVSLVEQQEQLEAEYASLGNELDSYLDVQMDIEDQIKYLQELVDLYSDLGCDDDEDIKTCGKEVLPSNTKFYRPLAKGFATSEYSTNRVGTFSGFHSGLDQSVSPNTNVSVYASGTGVVSGIVYKSSCGGTYVLVHHKMTDGSTYTTMYMHLAKALVSKGDVVTKDTVIGIMGGGHNSSSPSNYTPWDSCTTGAHLHFTIATGLYGIDYSTWSSFMAHTVNPRTIVNFPSGRYNWWTDRITKY